MRRRGLNRNRASHVRSRRDHGGAPRHPAPPWRPRADALAAPNAAAARKQSLPSYLAPTPQRRTLSAGDPTRGHVRARAEKKKQKRALIGALGWLGDGASAEASSPTDAFQCILAVGRGRTTPSGRGLRQWARRRGAPRGHGGGRGAKNSLPVGTRAAERVGISRGRPRAPDRRFYRRRESGDLLFRLLDRRARDLAVMVTRASALAGRAVGARPRASQRARRLSGTGEGDLGTAKWLGGVQAHAPRRRRRAEAPRGGG